MDRHSRLGKVQGFTLVFVLIFVVITQLGVVEALRVGSAVDRREKEIQLEFIGPQFVKAISLYYYRNNRQLPKTLDDLLGKEDAVPLIRYIRKVYYDPLTNSKDWGLVVDSKGGIKGVYSKSTKTPLRSRFCESFEACPFVFEPPASQT